MAGLMQPPPGPPPAAAVLCRGWWESPCRWLVLVLGIWGLGLVSGCAVRSATPADPAAEGVGLPATWMARQQVALTEAGLLPPPSAYERHELTDLRPAQAAALRPLAPPVATPTDLPADTGLDPDRPAPTALLYMPPQASATAPAPLVVFSHGIGGSRQGYSHLGRHWAANGWASLHVQHPGSDSRLWTGSPWLLMSRMQQAAQESEALARVLDLRHALDAALAHPQLGPRLDAQRVAAAGHSYGANTVLLASGAAVPRQGQVLPLADPRIRAAVVISAPPFHGESDPAAILGALRLPMLHITSVGDDIRIPGYRSTAADRVALYRMTGSPDKALVVYRDGAHSMFTDRLSPGGETHNANVKRATQALTLAFLDRVFHQHTQAWAAWPEHHGALLAEWEGPLWDHKNR